MHEEVKVKGQGILSIVLAVEELKGKAFRDEVIAMLAGEVGEAVRYGSIVAPSWYPISWYRQLFATIESLAPSEIDLPRRLGRQSGQRDIKGIYRMVFRALSPELVMKQSGRLTKLFYQGVDVEIVETKRGFARAHYRDFFGFDHNLWQDIIGGAEAILEATGAKQSRTAIERGGGDNDAEMVAVVSWS